MRALRKEGGPDTDRNRWNRLYLAVASTAYPDPAVGVTHPDRRVVLVYLWAAGHRQPT